MILRRAILLSAAATATWCLAVRAEVDPKHPAGDKLARQGFVSLLTSSKVSGVGKLVHSRQGSLRAFGPPHGVPPLSPIF